MSVKTIPNWASCALTPPVPFELALIGELASGGELASSGDYELGSPRPASKFRVGAFAGSGPPPPGGGA